MTDILNSARASPVGKDPPMQSSLPPELRSLCREVLQDPIKRMDFLHALEGHLRELRDADRHGDAESYLRETIADLEADAEQLRKNKSRARFQVVSTLIAPAFVTVLTKVLVDHMPFG